MESYLSWLDPLRRGEADFPHRKVTGGASQKFLKEALRVETCFVGMDEIHFIYFIYLFLYS